MIVEGMFPVSIVIDSFFCSLFPQSTLATCSHYIRACAYIFSHVLSHLHLFSCFLITHSFPVFHCSNSWEFLYWSSYAGLITGSMQNRSGAGSSRSRKGREKTNKKGKTMRVMLETMNFFKSYINNRNILMQSNIQRWLSTERERDVLFPSKRKVHHKPVRWVLLV